MVVIKPDEVKVVKLPTLIPAWAAAQVILKNTIFWNNKYALSPSVIAHELVHIEQQRRFGMLRYWFQYACLLVRDGYANHPWEREAELRWSEYLSVAQKIVDKENYYDGKRGN